MDQFQTLARFVKRPGDNGGVIAFTPEANTLLKDNVVYKISNVLGGLLIVEVGESHLVNSPETWAFTLENVMKNYCPLLTTEEVSKL